MFCAEKQLAPHTSGSSNGQSLPFFPPHRPGGTPYRCPSPLKRDRSANGPGCDRPIGCPFFSSLPNSRNLARSPLSVRKRRAVADLPCSSRERDSRGIAARTNLAALFPRVEGRYTHPANQRYAQYPGKHPLTPKSHPQSPEAPDRQRTPPG